MSRTFRRKNFEQNRPRRGREFYLICDTFVNTGNGHEGYWIMREPTKAEFDKKYYWIHGESKGPNAWSPSRSSYRAPHEACFRMKNKQELCRYLKNPSSRELMMESDPPTCRRHWAWY